LKELGPDKNTNSAQVSFDQINKDLATSSNLNVHEANAIQSKILPKDSIFDSLTPNPAPPDLCLVHYSVEHTQESANPSALAEQSKYVSESKEKTAPNQPKASNCHKLNQVALLFSIFGCCKPIQSKSDNRTPDNWKMLISRDICVRISNFSWLSCFCHDPVMGHICPVIECFEPFLF
jgi:hypothetical protein